MSHIMTPDEYLENYLSEDVYARSIYQANERERKVSSNFARMTDKDLGKWITDHAAEQKSMIDVIVYDGEKRFNSVFRTLEVMSQADILYHSARNLLMEYYGKEKAEEISLPKNLSENDEDIVSVIKTMLQKYEYDDVAKTLIVLYQSGRLQNIIEKQLVSGDEVAKLVIEFYSDILDD